MGIYAKVNGEWKSVDGAEGGSGEGATSTFGIASSQGFIVPEGFSKVDIFAVGGGSGGSYPPHGGGGQVVEVSDLDVVPGSILTVTIGDGGTAGKNGGETTVVGDSGTMAAAEGGVVGSGAARAKGTWHPVWGWKAANGAANGDPRGVPEGGGGSGSTSCASGGQSAAPNTGSGGGGSGGGPGAGAGGSGFVGLMFK